MIVFGLLVLAASFNTCWVHSFGLGSRALNKRHVARVSILRAGTGSSEGRADLCINSRRGAIFGLLAAGAATVITPRSATAITPRKIPVKDQVAAVSTLPVTPSTEPSSSTGLALVPLSILAAGTVFTANTLFKKEETSTTSLYVQPAPYGVREGRNYWNGIDLAAAAANSKTSVKNAMDLITSQQRERNKEKSQGMKNANFTNNVSSAFFIKNIPGPVWPLKTSLRRESTKAKSQGLKNATVANNVPSAFFVNDLREPVVEQKQEIVNPTKVNSVRSQRSPPASLLDSDLNTDKSRSAVQIKSQTALATKTVVNKADDPLPNNNTLLADQAPINDDERIVLEAQREAEEAELLLRKAEAEAARLVKELAALGIGYSTSLLPLVKDEVVSEENDSSRQEGEVDNMAVTPDKDSAINELDASKAIPDTKSDPGVPSKAVPGAKKGDTPKAIVPPVPTKTPSPTRELVASKASSENNNVPGVTSRAAVGAKEGSMPKAIVPPVPTKTPPVPFSKLAGSIPPVSRVTATSQSATVQPVRTTRTTNLRELLKSNSK